MKKIIIDDFFIKKGQQFPKLDYISIYVEVEEGSFINLYEDRPDRNYVYTFKNNELKEKGIREASFEILAYKISNSDKNPYLKYIDGQVRLLGENNKKETINFSLRDLYF